MRGEERKLALRYISTRDEGLLDMLDSDIRVFRGLAGLSKRMEPVGYHRDLKAASRDES